MMLRRSRAILIVVFLGVTAHLEPAYSKEQPSAQSNEQGKWKIIEHIGKGFVADEIDPKTHGDLPTLQKDLSAEERLENFDILWQAIDRYYSFFNLKRIDWPRVKKRYASQVEAATNDDDYYRVLIDLMRELKDSHSFFWNCKLDRHVLFRPNVSICEIEGKAVVTHVAERSRAYAQGLRPGVVITRIDGLEVKEKIEQLRKVLPADSSERHFLAVAHQRVLDGEKNTVAKVTFLAPGAEVAAEAELQRASTVFWGNPWQFRALPFPVEKGKFLWFGTHPSGYGYIRIVTFEGREEIADEFDRVLDKLKDTPGLVIDVRDNQGGSGSSHARIVGRLVTDKKQLEISFRKKGPGHRDFTSRKFYVSPCGDWQYTKPVALLINALTGSASDLFACRMHSAGRVITVGRTTHGNLPGHSVVAVLPCGLVARISDSYVTDAYGHIIEVNGTAPQVHAEPTIKDVIAGTDSVIDRAVETLQHRGSVAGGTSREEASATAVTSLRRHQ